ncbi:MAG: hypothetical protein ABI597_01125 [Gammaproteobacteria bacterium]
MNLRKICQLLSNAAKTTLLSSATSSVTNTVGTLLLNGVDKAADSAISGAIGGGVMIPALLVIGRVLASTGCIDAGQENTLDQLKYDSIPTLMITGVTFSILTNLLGHAIYTATHLFLKEVAAASALGGVCVIAVLITVNKVVNCAKDNCKKQPLSTLFIQANDLPQSELNDISVIKSSDSMTNYRLI